MSIRSYLLALLIGCLLVSGGFAQDDSNVADADVAIVGKIEGLDKEVIETLLEGTSSKNSLIQDHSYSLLSKQNGLLDHVDAKRLSLRIEFALQSKSNDLGEHGFAMLDNSGVGEEEKQRNAACFLLTLLPSAPTSS